MPPEPPSGRGERLVAEQAVLFKVREITADQLGLELDEVNADSRLVEDLKMD